MSHLYRPIDSLYAVMPWDAIDNVVFDVGNVLLTFSPPELLSWLFPGQESRYSMFIERVFRSPCWVMLDRGELTVPEAASIMAGLDTELTPEFLHLLNGWIDLKHVINEGVDTLKKCKAMGKRCYVLSNYPQHGFDYIEKKFDFFQLFDGMIISSRVKLLKPSKEIFDCLLNTYQLDSSRTLFIDDTPANIEGALHAGIQGLCFNAPGKLARFFQL